MSINKIEIFSIILYKSEKATIYFPVPKQLTRFQLISTFSFVN